MISKIICCFHGPRLYKYKNPPENRFVSYEPLALESLPEAVISVIHTVYSFTKSSWFLVLPYMYMRGYFTKEGSLYLINLLGIVALLLCTSVTVRAVGRFVNPIYNTFLNVYLDKSVSVKQRNDALRNYSFEFSYAGVDFSVNSSEVREKVAKEFKPPFELPLHESLANVSTASKILNFPKDIFCNVAMHVVGRRMIYPGSLQFLNSLLTEPRETSRAKMMAENPTAKRVKIVTSRSDSVDAFVIDRRSSDNKNGQKLVICTEGNGGFYEVGILATPLQNGYSVLGWNHLGFGGSSGSPWPKNEQAAVDAVYKYARLELGFADEDIVLFAWSIGGYATSWLAMNYPNIHAVVIDASFDDLEPLAIAKMPAFAANFISRGIRVYMDLRVSDQLKEYPGPVLFIRRTRDEIITTQMGNLSSNRGNNLVLDILKHRYPELFQMELIDVEEHVSQYLSVPLDEHSEAWKEMEETVTKFRSEEAGFPSQLGKDQTFDVRKKMAEYLLQKYIGDLEDMHCTPLPHSRFRVPSVV